jgi:hypothetical protein
VDIRLINNSLALDRGEDFAEAGFPWGYPLPWRSGSWAAAAVPAPCRTRTRTSALALLICARCFSQPLPRE